MFEYLQTYFYGLRGLWRIMMGCWFVFHDAPDRAVANLAQLELKEDDSSELHALVNDAKDEIAFRAKRIMRDIEEASK